MSRDEYKCENWEEYNENYDDVKWSIISLRVELAKKCSEYVGYPLEKIWIFDFTKKVRVFYSEMWKEDMIKIPFIDKREYYCLVNYFEKQVDVLNKWSDGEFLFKI